MQPPELVEQLYLGTPLMPVEFGAVTPLLTCSLLNESVVARVPGKFESFRRASRASTRKAASFIQASRETGAGDEGEAPRVNKLTPAVMVEYFVYLLDNRAGTT